MEGEEVFTQSQVSQRENIDEGFVVTLRQGRSFFIAATGPDIHSWKVVKKFSSMSTSFMQTKGQACIDGVIYNVYDHCPGGLLSAKISLMGSGHELVWAESDIYPLFMSMLSAVHTLHSCRFLHDMITTKVFHIAPSGEARLGRLERVKKIKEQSLNEYREKEMQRLGCCFLSMVCLKRFSELWKMTAEQKIAILRDEAVVTLSPTMEDVINGALAGALAENLLDLMGASERSKYWDSSLDGNGELSTLPRQDTVVKQTEICTVCQAPSVFIPSCPHPLCSNCLKRYLHKLLLKKHLSTAFLVCKLCDKKLDLSSVLQAITEDSELSSRLQERLISSYSIACPKCKRLNYLAGATRVNVKCEYCGKKFCGNCGERLHLFDRCPQVERRSTVNRRLLSYVST